MDQQKNKARFTFNPINLLNIVQLFSRYNERNKSQYSLLCVCMFRTEQFCTVKKKNKQTFPLNIPDPH
jgi:hypothetical protein